MKGVILAGGKGERLRQISGDKPKALVTIHDKPAIYFPLLTLAHADADRIIIQIASEQYICDIEHIITEEFTGLEGKIDFDVKEEPEGTAAALYHLGNRIKGDSSLLIFGDIYLTFDLELPDNQNNCCLYLTTNYARERIREYGIAELDAQGRILSLEEKPDKPKGAHVAMAVTFFPRDLSDVLENMGVKPGQTYIDVVNKYRESGRLSGRIHDAPWFNLGTPDDVISAATYRANTLRDAPRLNFD